MSRYTRHVIVVITRLALVAAVPAALARAEGAADLAALRAATVRFHDPAEAQAVGYAQVEGLDHCFNNPGEGAMGFHLIKTPLDLELDPLAPEAMVYAPGPNGQLQLGAVEFIVPAAGWDEAYPGQLPMVLGQHLHLNAALGVYVLHAWVWHHNPAGMFADWNPTVTCPA
jgi:hypothetical protein